MDEATISCSAIEFHEDGNSTVRASMRMEAGSLVIRGMPGVHIRIEADEADVSINGRNVQASAQKLARVEGCALELHGAESLKEDANGVGHTYTGTEAHFWVPMVGGTANWPAPPEHPLIGNDNLTTPQTEDPR